MFYFETNRLNKKNNNYNAEYYIYDDEIINEINYDVTWCKKKITRGKQLTAVFDDWQLITNTKKTCTRNK